MRWMKKILYFILGVFAALCGLVIVCAFRPDITEFLARFLYSDEEQAVITQTPDASGTDEPICFPEIIGSDETGQEQTKHQQTDLSETETGAIAEDIVSEYIAPDQADVVIPENVNGKTGYQRVRADEEQIEDDAAKELLNRIGTGPTGDGLQFDPVYYPYYSMLDDKGQHLYRQIYANANELNGVFAPVEDVTAGQLKNVFSAVYNDHPELFWLETAYACKYIGNGQCVEIDLQFNRTAQNLESAKTVFEERAGLILAAAQNLENDYEKEKYVHDVLIDNISYNMGAEMNQSAYSALVNGQTVCAGYARAFQYLLQQLGIPCYYCTGYAGESHAWNIILLEDGYYHVDTTWDDTDGGNYDYFNKTDQDFGSTHIRQELSVYLPPCNGQQYRNLEQNEETADSLRSMEDVGMTEADILHSIPEYYENCYDQIVSKGQGSYEFYNVIEGEALLQELYSAYQTDDYRQGYMEQAMSDIGAFSCEMSLEIEELEQQRFLVIHKIEFF